MAERWTWDTRSKHWSRAPPQTHQAWPLCTLSWPNFVQTYPTHRSSNSPMPALQLSTPVGKATGPVHQPHKTSPGRTRSGLPPSTRSNSDSPVNTACKRWSSTRPSTHCRCRSDTRCNPTQPSCQRMNCMSQVRMEVARPTTGDKKSRWDRRYYCPRKEDKTHQADTATECASSPHT